MKYIVKTCDCSVNEKLNAIYHLLLWNEKQEKSFLKPNGQKNVRKICKCLFGSQPWSTTLSGRNFLSKGAISGDLIFIAWTKL